MYYFNRLSDGLLYDENLLKMNLVVQIVRIRLTHKYIYSYY